MTISKKLLLLATLGLGLNIPCITSANYNVELHHEMTTISNFMPELHQHTTVGADKVAQWLRRKLQKQSLNKYDANAIANIIRSNATTESKVANILQIITIKETNKAHLAKRASNEQRRLKAKKIAETALVCGLGIFCGALILIDAATNPWRWYQEPETTTVSYTFGNKGESTSYTYTYNDNPRPTCSHRYSYPNFQVTYQL